MTAIVELHDVTRSFPGPPEVRALNTVNLRVDAGDYVSISGPSGSGKSTMLNLLGLLDRPTVGDYVLSGVSTTALGERERADLRAREIGFVFQSFHLMPHRSVLENVLVGMLYNRVPRAEREERARAALERVGLGHRIDYEPMRLSGGERQRVAIARAVSARPQVLLADEPTGNLDQATAMEVIGLFEDLHDEGHTLILITHDGDLAARASRRLRIDAGHVEELS